MNIQIKVDEFALILRADSAWWLDVKWEIRNLEKQTYYVLTKGFLSLSVGDSLLIDHTTESKSYMIDGNIDPVVKFEILNSESSIILQNHYPLPHIKEIGSGGIKVVGKFSISKVKPDPAWATSSNWESIKVWENRILSPAFKIKS